jgi:hypothetical protein
VVEWGIMLGVLGDLKSSKVSVVMISAVLRNGIREIARATTGFGGGRWKVLFSGGGPVGAFEWGFNP